MRIQSTTLLGGKGSTPTWRSMLRRTGRAVMHAVRGDVDEDACTRENAVSCPRAFAWDNLVEGMLLSAEVDNSAADSSELLPPVQPAFARSPPTRGRSIASGQHVEPDAHGCHDMRGIVVQGTQPHRLQPLMKFFVAERRARLDHVHLRRPAAGRAEGGSPLDYLVGISFGSCLSARFRQLG